MAQVGCIDASVLCCAPFFLKECTVGLCPQGVHSGLFLSLCSCLARHLYVIVCLSKLLGLFTYPSLQLPSWCESWSVCSMYYCLGMRRSHCHDIDRCPSHFQDGSTKACPVSARSLKHRMQRERVETAQRSLVLDQIRAQMDAGRADRLATGSGIHHSPNKHSARSPISSPTKSSAQHLHQRLGQGCVLVAN